MVFLPIFSQECTTSLGRTFVGEYVMPIYMTRFFTSYCGFNTCVKCTLKICISLILLCMIFNQDGGVFTFGSGTNGQLGHNSNFHQYQPRKVCWDTLLWRDLESCNIQFSVYYFKSVHPLWMYQRFFRAILFSPVIDWPLLDLNTILGSWTDGHIDHSGRLRAVSIIVNWICAGLGIKIR